LVRIKVGAFRRLLKTSSQAALSHVRNYSFEESRDVFQKSHQSKGTPIEPDGIQKILPI
jgi:hypothetical protein